MLLQLLLACTTPPPSTPAVPAGKAVVLVSSFPAQYLVQRLAQDSVELINILPPGEDPPFWSPGGELVAQAQGADLLVLNGAGFEAWVATASLNEDRVLDSAKGLDLIKLNGTPHSHGKGGTHSHKGSDPHTWGDPLLYAEQARAVHAGLSKLPGTSQESLDAALASLVGDLQALDAEYSSVLTPAQELHMSANHPSFNYLARRYELDITAFALDPEEGPSDLGPWESWAKEQLEPILIWEAPPSAKALAAFPESVRHFTLDPLEQPGGNGRYDYFAQARANLLVLGELAPAE